MEFHYSSEEELNVDYDSYQHTPYSDPSVIKRLWGEHFSRKPKKRNREITRAFEMKCSLYQFMHPQLSRDEVRTMTLDSVFVRTSSTASKRPDGLLGKTSKVSANNEGQSHLEKSSTKRSICKKSNEVNLGSVQDKNEVKKLSSTSKSYQHTSRKPLKTRNIKPSKKTLVLEELRIETSQVVCANVDFNTMNSEGTKIKTIGSRVERSHYPKQSVSILTKSTETCTNDFLVTTVSKKYNNKKRDEINLKADFTPEIDTLDRSLQENNTCTQKCIKTIPEDANKIKTTKKRRKNKDVKGKENLRVSELNATRTKSFQGNSSQMKIKPSVWKKIKLPYDPLQNLTSLGIIKYEKLGSTNKITGDTVTSKKQEGSV